VYLHDIYRRPFYSGSRPRPPKPVGARPPDWVLLSEPPAALADRAGRSDSIEISLYDFPANR